MEYFLVLRGGLLSTSLLKKGQSTKSRHKKGGGGGGKLLDGQWDFPSASIQNVAEKLVSKDSSSEFNIVSSRLYNFLGLIMPEYQTRNLNKTRTAKQSFQRRVIDKVVTHTFSHVKYQLCINHSYLPHDQEIETSKWSTSEGMFSRRPYN